MEIERPEPRIPDPDATGQGFMIVSLGAPAVPVAEAWTAQISPGLPVLRLHADRLDDGLLAEFRHGLGRIVIGWRLMLAGPEDAIQVLRAAAVEEGALRCEIRAHATSADRLRVYCAHCRTIGLAGVGVGGIWPCPGCGRRLAVRPHHSARLAARLGSLAEPEEP